jgi:hypothetical protein
MDGQNMLEMHVKCWFENSRQRPLGRPGRRREDNTETDIRKTGCEHVKWFRAGSN